MRPKFFVIFIVAFYAMTTTNLVGADSNTVTAKIGGGIDPVIFPFTLPLGSMQEAQDFEARQVTHVEVGLQHLPPGATTWVGLPTMIYDFAPTDKSNLQAATGNLITKHMSAYAKYFKDPALGVGQMALGIECFVDDGPYYNVPLYIVDGDYGRNVFVSRTLFRFTDQASDGTWLLPASVMVDAITGLTEPDGNIYVNLPWLTDVQGGMLLDNGRSQRVAGVFGGGRGAVLGARFDKSVVGTKNPTVVTFVSQMDVAWYDENGVGSGGLPLRITRMAHVYSDYLKKSFDAFAVFCYFARGQAVVIESSRDFLTWTPMQVLRGAMDGIASYNSLDDGFGLTDPQLQTLQSRKQAAGDAPTMLFYRARYK